MKIKTTFNIRLICNELVEQSKKEGLLFSKGILFFVLHDNEIPVAFFGLKINNKTAIIKCDYVSKDYRGNRLLYKMINYRLNWLKKKVPSVKKVFANTTEMATSSHIKAGAKILNRYKNKITKVEYEIL